MLTNIDSAYLQSTPAYLSVECKIAEPRVSGKPTIIIHEKVFEVVASGDCRTGGLLLGSYCNQLTHKALQQKVSLM